MMNRKTDWNPMLWLRQATAFVALALAIYMVLLATGGLSWLIVTSFMIGH